MRQLFAELVLALVAVCGAACAPLHYTLLEGSTVGGPLLVPPRLASAPAASFTVTMPGATAGPRCTERSTQFELQAMPGALAVRRIGNAGDMAAPAIAIDTPGAVSFSERDPGHRALLAAIEDLARAGCIPGGATAEALRRVQEGVPQTQSGMADAFGYPGEDGFFTLHAGEQLRVTTPLLDTSGQWQGSAELYYELRQDRHGATTIVPVRTVTHAGDGSRRLHPQSLGLPSSPSARLWRMIVFGRSNDYRQVNILVGARDIADMDAAVATVQSTDRGCMAVKVPVLCVAPKYGTVINVELAVRVQGQLIALPVGATVASALRRYGPGGGRGVPPKLRVLRPYRGRLAAVTWPPGSDAILQLVLAGGESISWK